MTSWRQSIPRVSCRAVSQRVGWLVPLQAPSSMGKTATLQVAEQSPSLCGAAAGQACPSARVPPVCLRAGSRPPAHISGTVERAEPLGKVFGSLLRPHRLWVGSEVFILQDGVRLSVGLRRLAARQDRCMDGKARHLDLAWPNGQGSGLLIRSVKVRILSREPWGLSSDGQSAALSRQRSRVQVP
jgi:hypothetical protein